MFSKLLTVKIRVLKCADAGAARGGPSDVNQAPLGVVILRSHGNGHWGTNPRVVSEKKCEIICMHNLHALVGKYIPYIWLTYNGAILNYVYTQ